MTRISKSRIIVWMSLLALVACSDGGSDGNEHDRSVRRTVPAGAIDTLRLADTVSVVVDNTSGSVSADVEVRSSPDTGSITGPAVTSRALIRVHSIAVSARRPELRERSVGTVLRAVFTTVRDAASSLVSFAVQGSGVAGSVSSATIPLWTTSSGTDYVDPVTGALRSIHTLAIAPDTPGSTDYLISVVNQSGSCSPGPRLVDRDPGVAPSQRIPLVLIHGWQLPMIYCGPASDPLSYAHWDTDANAQPFDEWLANADAVDPAVRQRYHVYVMHYPTFRPVIEAAIFLKGALVGLGGGPPVIVAHSMGGLVARSMLGLSGAPAIRGLITVGTPHAGVPAAALIAGQASLPAPTLFSIAVNCGLTTAIAAELTQGVATVVKPTDGLMDLSPQSELIRALTGTHPSGDRIYAIGGAIDAYATIFDDYLSPVACLTNQLGSTASDGVVPTPSAMPSWAAGQMLVANTNHTALPAAPTVVGRIDSVLKRWSDCEAVIPPPTSSNPFPVSGSIAREPDGTVDLTINGIVINGIVQTGLNASNFQIVENGCALGPSQFHISTGEGHVGLDVVFVQDLSSSMDPAIASVRNSVTTFVAGLAARGLDVRIGSVGYSGFGTIPSTPAGSVDEYLGPVQDLTDVNTFRNHVASQWFSGFGGDIPENGLEAIEFAMNTLHWRSGAARVLIDITNSGHHFAGDGCGCTDENLTSITTLLAGRAVVHVVAPTAASTRTTGNALDPYLLANVTGGRTLAFGTGAFDLNTIGISDALVATTRLTFRSASPVTAPDNLRIIVTINGMTSELSPGLLTYVRADASIRH